MRDKNKDTEKLVRNSIEHRLSSRVEVDYFSQNLSLKPLRVIMNFLLEDSAKNKIELVLDAGCGIGLFEFLTYSGKDGVFQHTFSTVGIDIDCKRLDIARTLMRENYKAHFVRSSINNLPFNKKVFQATFVHDLFYALNINLALSEIARVTRFLIYFDIPNRFFYSFFPFLKPNPSYLTYDLSDVRKELLSLDFEVTKIIPAPLVSLVRRFKFPPQVARALFAFLLASPPYLRNSVCTLWPLIVLRARRPVHKTS